MIIRQWSGLTLGWLVETQRWKKGKVNRDKRRICQCLTIKVLLGGNVVLVLLLCQSFCRVCSSCAPFCELDLVNFQLSVESVSASSYASKELCLWPCPDENCSKLQPQHQVLQMDNVDAKSIWKEDNGGIISPQVLKLSHSRDFHWLWLDCVRLIRP